MRQARLKSLAAGCITSTSFCELSRGWEEPVDFVRRTLDVIRAVSGACWSFVKALTGFEEGIFGGKDAGCKFQHAKSRHRVIALSRYRAIALSPD